MLRAFSVYSSIVPLKVTLQVGSPVTLQISSIGSVVRSLQLIEGSVYLVKLKTFDYGILKNYSV